MTEITAVRLSEMDGAGRNVRVLAQFPRNKGSCVILDKDCKVEIEIDGEWETLWEARISNNVKYGPEDSIQLDKGRVMAELIDLIRKYKKFLDAAVTKDFKEVYRAKLAGLELAFDSIAVKGEIGPDTVMLCSIKDQILKDA